MSLEVNLGKRGNILEVGPQNTSQVMLAFSLFPPDQFLFNLDCDSFLD